MQIRKSKAILMAAILASVAVGAAGGGSQEAPSKPADERSSALVVQEGEPVQGLSLAITQAKGAREVGGHAWIRIDLRNGTGAVHEVPDTLGLFSNFSLKLRYKQDPVELTRYGKRAAMWKDMPRSAGGDVVQPGESWRSYVDLARVFDLSLAGTYLLTVERRIKLPGSNDEVTLRVTDVPIVVSGVNPPEALGWATSVK